MTASSASNCLSLLAPLALLTQRGRCSLRSIPPCIHDHIHTHIRLPVTPMTIPDLPLLHSTAYSPWSHVNQSRRTAREQLHPNFPLPTTQTFSLTAYLAVSCKMVLLKSSSGTRSFSDNNLNCGVSRLSPVSKVALPHGKSLGCNANKRGGKGRKG